METYLLQASGCLILFYAVYHFLLSRLTYFEFNRWFLLASLVASILIPWIGPMLVIEKPMLFGAQMTEIEISGMVMMEETKMTFSEILILILKGVYFVGFALVLSKTIVGLQKIFSMYRKGEKSTLNGTKVVWSEKTHLPFSFMNTIFMSKNLDLLPRMEEVFLHEKIHINRFHTMDVLFSELVHAIFWFNPILIFYKRALKESHEYIADALVTQEHSKVEYSQLLLSHSVSGLQIELTNQFFNSQIKKRIIMMNANHSTRKSLARYLLVIPLLAVLGFVFASAKIADGTIPASQEVKNFLLDTLPDDPTVYINEKKSSREELSKISPDDIYHVIVDKANGASGNPHGTIKVYTKDYEKLDEVKVQAPPPPPVAPRIADGYTSKELPTEQVFKIVEQMPRFPGCEDFEGDNREKENCAKQKMLEYIYTHIKYPKKARENGIEGTAVVQFMINKQGEITDINVVRDPGAGLGEAAQDVVGAMNTLKEKWTPGSQRGEAVNVLYTLPVKFKLQNDQPANNEQKVVVEGKQVLPTNFIETVNVIGYGNVKTVEGFKINDAGEATGVKSAEGTKIQVRETNNNSGSVTSPATTVQVRGFATSTSSKPLYVIDGKEVEDVDLAKIDPSTIESISVLKDASATELYGSRAKDGVIIIATKGVKDVKQVDLKLKKAEPAVKVENKTSDLEEVVVVGYGTSNKDGAIKGKISEQPVKVENRASDMEEVVVQGYNPNGPSMKEVHFTAFPNPAKDNVQVKLESTTSEDIEIRLYNMLGQEVKKETIKGRKGTIEHNVSIPESLVGQSLVLNLRQGQRSSSQQVVSTK